MMSDKTKFKETESAKYFGHAQMFVVVHRYYRTDGKRATAYYTGLTRTQAIDLCTALGEKLEKAISSFN